LNSLTSNPYYQELKKPSLGGKMGKIKATAEWIRDFQLVIKNSRGHQVVCDYPVTGGGDNAGSTPLDLAVMSLAGCAAMIFTDVCKQSKIQLDKLEVVAEAEKHAGTPKLADICIEAKVSSKSRKQLLEAAWRRTEASCPVLYVYKDALPVRVQFEIAE
jgi:uncharacterized OsmC-like protein